ncbi:hypothetical protein J5N97_025955 [Dioscorea zingiberensis]|uniref:Phytocyanin domain-containing protein n=1 Tax=Dioscorea zingiberensis TaxID=325984 RepID=A0A9D5H6E7_9LILI|nr:hypothetical protein J5N97_025955 [Dioscorea zingiberensis]
MSSSSSLKNLPLLILIILPMITITIGASKEYNVGDDLGWRIPEVNNSNMYVKWADKNTFHIGDSLVFKYQNDSVIRVDKRGYYHCNQSSHDHNQPMADGNTVFVLDKPGIYYFVSGDFQHCKNGQRLMINVKDPNSPSSPKDSSYGLKKEQDISRRSFCGGRGPEVVTTSAWEWPKPRSTSQCGRGMKGAIAPHASIVMPLPSVGETNRSS